MFHQVLRLKDDTFFFKLLKYSQYNSNPEIKFQTFTDTYVVIHNTYNILITVYNIIVLLL